MKILILYMALFTFSIGCKTSSQEEHSVKNLKKSFKAKDEAFF
ncbi:hypothetical protein J2W48_003420 [Flavobacterium piscis]|uniref:Uncharacterized protein n=1 Tax=Flavobacterium piscis TaxID=1114874 RepID=A0ABU1YD65_9FLAO|nr:hypothetical protein [Flavobacterium piscis]